MFMDLRSAVLVVAVMLAGCSGGDGAQTDVATTAAPPFASPGSTAKVRTEPGRVAGASNAGALLVYPSLRPVKRVGLSALHAAAISEAHALGSAEAGQPLLLETPGGRRLAFAPSRVERAPGENWTWVGTLRDGSRTLSAVITFGQHAVFGMIEQPAGEPLRIVTIEGATYVAEASRGKAWGPSVPSTGLDVVPAPALEAAEAMARVESSIAATPAAGATVDIVLGYTAGYSRHVGGDSRVGTRLAFLVAFANQTFINSELSGRVRLVGTVQVDYPDSTPWSVALSDASGYTATGSTHPIPATLQPLRDARERYGADLVSLIRYFDTGPEQQDWDTCGGSWLLGAGRTGVDAADAPFGYSVVQDRLVPMQVSYECGDVWLAHELVHNLGGAHDRNSAAGSDGILQDYEYGAFEYSFGLALPEEGRYTLDSGSRFLPYNMVSNPRLLHCGGQPCGVEGLADNARTLERTFPIVASFRQSVVSTQPRRTRLDIDGDGRGDVVWHNPNIGLEVWFMDGARWTYGGAHRVDYRYEVAGTGDLNGDGRADILWRDRPQTELWAWLMRADGSPDIVRLGRYPEGWAIVGVRDADADGRDDIFWHNANVGVQLWFMNGVRWRHGDVRPVSAKYRVAGVGDFDGDGAADILWVDREQTQLWVWKASPGASDVFFNSSLLRPYPTGWNVAGVADMDNDYRDEVVWIETPLPGSSLRSVQPMGLDPVFGGALFGERSFVGSQFDIIGLTDTDGDGSADIVWRDAAGTQVWSWLTGAVVYGPPMTPQPRVQYTPAYLRDYPAGWSIVGRD